MQSPSQEENPSMIQSPEQSSNSKGSPNEEKNKQVYKNLLAQQCLGEDIFSIAPSYENLTNPLLAGGNN